MSTKKLFMKPLKALASPGIYLFGKYNQYKREREQSNTPSTPAENELSQLNTKIDKLLNKLNGKHVEMANTPEEECVICVNAKAVMQTYPCGHKVVCRRCFVKTIQIALAQRTLPLRCVICRAKILRLKHTQNSSGSSKMSSIPSFQSRSSSCSTSKQRSSSEMVTRSCSLEENPWQSRASKYSKSLPGISGGSLKYRSSVNRSHSAVVYRKPANTTRKCCKSCSLSSCSSLKGSNNTKPPIEYRHTIAEQPNYNEHSKKLDENVSTISKEAPNQNSKKPTASLSREELIQQFQRDFREGQLSSVRSNTARHKPTPHKVSNTPTKRTIDSTKPTTKNTNSTADRRKPAPVQETVSTKCYEKPPKTKEKNTKALKLLKLEKKEKKLQEKEPLIKVTKKDKKAEKKAAKQAKA